MGIDWFLKLSNDNAELRQRIAELEQSIKHILAYPGIKEYIGTLLYNEAQYLIDQAGEEK